MIFYNQSPLAHPDYMFSEVKELLGKQQYKLDIVITETTARTGKLSLMTSNDEVNFYEEAVINVGAKAIDMSIKIRGSKSEFKRLDWTSSSGGGGTLTAKITA